MEPVLLRRSRLIFVCLAAVLVFEGCSRRESFSQATSPITAPLIAPENGLEAALLKAAAAPSYRPLFERDFLAADVFMRTDPAAIADLQKSIGDDGKLTRKTDVYFWAFKDERGQVVVPVFTSATRLRSVYPGKAWVRLKGREVLRMVGGHSVVVNRSLSPQITWTPSDISAIRAADGRVTD